MGYYIEQKDLLVKIPVSKKEELLSIFKKLKEDEQILGGGGESRGGVYSKKWYSFADDFEYSDKIISMFESFRYVCIREKGYYIIDEFLGEKLGDDYLFWGRLKPIITKDSVCKFWGEDHSILDFLRA